MSFLAIKLTQEDLEYFNSKKEKILLQLESADEKQHAELKELLVQTEEHINKISSQHASLQINEILNPFRHIQQLCEHLTTLNAHELVKTIDNNFEDDFTPSTDQILSTITNIESTLEEVKHKLDVFTGKISTEENAEQLLDNKMLLTALDNTPDITFSSELSDYVAKRRSGKNLEDFFKENTSQIKTLVTHYEFNFELISVYLAHLGLSNGIKIDVNTLKGYCSKFKIPVNRFKVGKTDESETPTSAHEEPPVEPDAKSSEEHPF